LRDLNSLFVPFLHRSSSPASASDQRGLEKPHLCHLSHSSRALSMVKPSARGPHHPSSAGLDRLFIKNGGLTNFARVSGALSRAAISGFAFSVIERTIC
jgi:hypothetical protein